MDGLVGVCLLSKTPIDLSFWPSLESNSSLIDPAFSAMRLFEVQFAVQLVVLLVKRPACRKDRNSHYFSPPQQLIIRNT